MKRRRLLQLTALGGVAAAGAGYWALPRAVAPAPVSLEAAQRLLAGWEGRPLVSLAGWSPAEVFNHCAQSIEFSLTGYPQLKPAWFRHSVGPLAFDLFAARGAMCHPLDEAIPGAPALDAPVAQAEALARLQRAFAAFAGHTGELAPHFAYGALDHAEYAQAHVMHLYDHLSRLRLA